MKIWSENFERTVAMLAFSPLTTRRYQLTVIVMGIQPLIIDIIHRLDLLDLFDVPTPGLDVQRRPAFPLALTSDPTVFAKQERFALMPRRT